MILQVTQWFLVFSCLVRGGKCDRKLLWHKQILVCCLCAVAGASQCFLCTENVISVPKAVFDSLQIEQCWFSGECLLLLECAALVQRFPGAWHSQLRSLGIVMVVPRVVVLFNKDSKSRSSEVVPSQSNPGMWSSFPVRGWSCCRALCRAEQ